MPLTYLCSSQTNVDEEMMLTLKCMQRIKRTSLIKTCLDMEFMKGTITQFRRHKIFGTAKQTYLAGKFIELLQLS
jgi:hypothetical protein